MELSEVRRLGESLLAEHGLVGWSFGFDNARRRAGLCNYSARRVSVSRTLMALYSPAQVRETILHEVAHALAGAEHGHDAVWRAVARRIGSTGDRLVAEDAPRAPAPWVGRCPAGHTVDRYRRPTAPMSCRRCAPRFSAEHVLRWTFHGREVAMPASYERALRELTHRVPAGTSAGTRARFPDAPGWAGSPDSPWDEGWLGGEPGADWGEEDSYWDGEAAGEPFLRQGAALAGLHRSLAAAGGLRRGTQVRIAVPGRYEGVTGTVAKVGRTRYHVRTREGLLTVSFAGVVPVD